MRQKPWLVMLVAGGLLAGAAADTSAEESLVRVESDGGRGIGFVIHQETRGDVADIYIMTSARLFSPGMPLTAQLLVGDQGPLQVTHHDIFIPFDNYRDAAIVRATVTVPRGVPVTVSYDRVAAGALFVVAGLDASNRRVTVAEQARFVTTRAVSGDRPLGALDGCLGAAAFVDDTVFGVVTECEPGRVPVVLPLSAARGFIKRVLPGAHVTTGELIERDAAPTELRAPSGAVTKGEVEIPLELSAGESLLGASARVVERRGLKLADVAVSSVGDRTVKLRFILGGEPVPSIPSGWAHALVVVRVTLVRDVTGERQ